MQQSLATHYTPCHMSSQRLATQVHRLSRALLRRGERRIVLDLACVSRIDAAGIGELVRAYNLANASQGAFRIVNANRRVREMLQRAGLFDRLNVGSSDMAGADGQKTPTASVLTFPCADPRWPQ